MNSYRLPLFSHSVNLGIFFLFVFPYRLSRFKNCLPKDKKDSIKMIFKSSKNEWQMNVNISKESVNKMRKQEKPLLVQNRLNKNVYTVTTAL